MPHFFCDQINGSTVTLTDETAKHMSRVLRMKLGENFTLSTQDGQIHQCQISAIDTSSVIGVILSSAPSDCEPTLSITLYQALPKGDKMELILQKAVELGVHKIVPMQTARCVSRPDAKAMAKKCQRYRKIVEAAAKQSGRNILPEVTELHSFAQVCDVIGSHQTALVCYEGGGKRLRDLIAPDCTDLAIVIGSEGGLELDEVQALQACGVSPATLGKLILRCETAPLAAISIAMALTDNI